MPRVCPGQWILRLEHLSPQGPGLGSINCPSLLLVLVCGSRKKENLEMQQQGKYIKADESLLSGLPKILYRFTLTISVYDTHLVSLIF